MREPSERDENVAERSVERMQEKGPRQGHISAASASGTPGSNDRASFSDPVAGNMDPTSPQSPEQTMPFSRHDARDVRESARPSGPAQQNLEDWRRRDVNSAAVDPSPRMADESEPD